MRITSIWKKTPVEEEKVKIFLIHYTKSQNIENAGEWAESTLIDAKAAPELPSRAFVKDCMGRNRSRRISGKYLFAKWARGRD